MATQQEYEDEALVEAARDRVESTTYMNDIAGAQDQVWDNLQFQKHLITPDAKSKFPYINKDILAGNLDPIELVYLRKKATLIHSLEYVSNNTDINVSEVADYFMEQVYFVLNSSLSKDGFLRKNLRTTTTELKREQKPSRMPFGFMQPRQ